MSDDTPCDVCGEVRETAPFGSRQLCENCYGKPVKFSAECTDCDWSYNREGRESQRYPTKQNVQMKANNHEKEKQIFEDESHETNWEEIQISDADD